MAQMELETDAVIESGGLRIAVRALAEYACRGGSIVYGFRSAVAMTEGARIHKEIQAAYGEQDERELFLREQLEHAGVRWTIEGRCDGLLREEGMEAVDEIKSVSMPLGELPEDGFRVHWAQAMGYAYMFAVQQERERMRVQLTYVQKDTGEVRRLSRICSMEELKASMLWLLEAYAPYARMMQRHRERRDASLGGLDFPFGRFRPGQKRLSAAVYRTLETRGGLFAKAPTGIGKTMSVLWPAVRSLGEVSRLFYLTARTTTRAAAEDALRRMEKDGLIVHAVTLTAKEKICPQPEVRCDGAECPFADGYFDRINGAVLDLLQEETLITRETVERYALKHRVCPFEFSLDAAYAADVIIGDYNYVFDPKISLKRLLAEQARRSALLVDEAHNLPDRARAMYSAALDKAPFLALQRSFKSGAPALAAAAKAVNAQFIALRKQMDAGGEGPAELKAAGAGIFTGEAPPQELLAAVSAFAETAAAALAAGEVGGSAGIITAAADGRPAEAEAVSVAARSGAADEGADAHAPDASKLLLETYWAAKSFEAAGGWYDERFAFIAERSKGGSVKVTLQCLDPSQLLRQTAKHYGGRVFFSATLSPLSFYMDQLGADEEDRSLTLPSPFDSGQLDVEIVPYSTRYADRETTLQPLVRKLLQETSGRGGNWLVFFPSYAYMNAAFRQLLAELGAPDEPDAEDAAEDGVSKRFQPGAAYTLGNGKELRLQLQRPEMSEEERDGYLSVYETSEAGAVRVGFAVMGGVFSEGVDLTGDRLTGVAVVGVGLPQIGSERDLLAAYEQRQGRSGFDYAYVYPGIGKVLQAGGRLIRSEEDRGALLLIDDRYRQPRYRRLLPEEWLQAADRSH
ncbi:ATP-dependent DNA helicase [Paenibacillus pasadenensis]|uniref:ATP-dependent DNA helicase n=1 Tax=Paenibacillus pasadenensis TaxID=217090 RepID=UPI00203ADA53|nr:ATP-dependent DNA helicase [Paenibacillus pasadenensis]MCM3747740.1 ATP-dependent DNA helicase [Paenibacillus pasadenensis]